MRLPADWKHVLLLTALVVLSTAPSSMGDSFFTPVKKLTAGSSKVSVSGDIIVVASSGAVYVFERNAGGSNNWGQVKQLTPTSQQDEVRGFGASVSVSGNVVVVGASQTATEFNANVGSAYVFERNAGGTNNWGQVKELFVGTVTGYFGDSVSVGADVVVVGALGIGIGFSARAAFVFERNLGGANNWGQRTMLFDDTPVRELNSSVSVSGDIVVVSWGGIDAQMARSETFVYERNRGGANNWGQVQRLTVSGSEMAGLARSVSVSGNVLVAGAPGDDVDATVDQGSAYVFERNAGGADNWGQVRKLTAIDGVSFDLFGSSVSISGDALLIGAPGDVVGANVAQGSAYLFERNAGGTNNWGLIQKLIASDGAPIGLSVSVNGNDIVAGGEGGAYVFGPGVGSPPPAQILQHPLSRTNLTGSTATFSVRAMGIEPLGYRWHKDDVGLADSGRVSGASSVNLVLTNLQFSDGGSYHVVVSNFISSANSNVIGFVTSQVANLTVLPMIITAQPLSQSVLFGSNATFSVSVTSSVPVAYQWQFSGADIAEATNATLDVPIPQVEGSYQVKLMNSYGSLTSQVAQLTVLPNILIVQPPLGQSVVAGGNVTFSVEVIGYPPGPFDYEWRKLAGLGFTNKFELNEPRSFFTVTNLQAPDTGFYGVTVRNAGFTNGVARSVRVTVLVDTDRDGQPDLWEAAHGFNTNDMADAMQDADGDSMTNWEEYIAGTDPNNAASVLRITGFTAGNPATLEFEALSNKTYTVQHTDRVGDDSWSKLADVVAHATNRTETATDVAAGTNRYYRLVTPRQP